MLLWKRLRFGGGRDMILEDLENIVPGPKVRGDLMIRLARMADMPRLLEIYAAARAFMRQNGNMEQWAGGYPGEAVLVKDIALGQLYAIEEKGRIGGVFMLAAGPDDTYAVIYGGAWGREQPYGVIHRIAGDGSIKGLLAKAVEFAGVRFDYLRIDTHAQNFPMQKALSKEGFAQRGVIYLHDGNPRLAYDKLLKTEKEKTI